jgi:histone-lysine N-methyltransferase SETMAR
MHPHTAAHTGVLLEHFNWVLFDHPPYSTDLVPSDYYLFTYLKNWIGSQSFNSIELMESVIMWLSSEATDFDTGTQELIPQYDMCLNSSSEYAEK